ncbi:MAG: GNVR domain-containing protein [Candidatus Margulisiibacteriota bacterium]
MEDEINLKDILAVLYRWRSLILLITFLFGAAAFIAFSFMDPVYEAKSRILMRSSSSSSIGSVAGLAALAGINIGSSGGGLGDIQALIESRKVNDYVSKEAAVLSKDGKPVGLGKLKSKIDGVFLVISVSHRDPNAAQLISNAYIHALAIYWNKLNYSEAQKKIDYITAELPKIQAQLAAAENKLKSLMYLTDQQGAVETVDVLRAKREVEILNSVYTMLRGQLESAKLDAAKEMSPFSDVEEALLPEAPVSPRRGVNTVIGLIMGLFVSVFAAFLLDYLMPQRRK